MELEIQKYRHVCFVNNSYILLQYLMLIGEDEIDKTFFFFASDVQSDIKSRFPHAQLRVPKSKLLSAFYLLLLKVTANLRWPFLKHCDYWGQDNLLITSPILKDNKLTILEDGWLSYNFKPVKHRFVCVRRLLLGNLLAENGLGYSNNVTKIYLTGALDIPATLAHKVELIDYSVVWNNLSALHKQRICEVFNMTLADIEFFRDKPNVLFTQPLSEDGFLTETEKIELYERVINVIDGDVLIKQHPREKTDYKTIFPNCEVFTSPIPLELLSLVGVKFSNVYTLFSTAVLNINYKTNIHWLGAFGNKKLLERFGNKLTLKTSQK